MAYNYEYPYTDPNRYNDDWLLNKMKELIEEWAKVQTDWTDQQTAFESLKEFVNNYFDNLDVQEEINNKLDAMAEDGSLGRLLSAYQPFVTPELFGAVGNGVTDDYDAFIACIRTKKKIVLYNKKYRLSRPLAVTTEGLFIEGNSFNRYEGEMSEIVCDSGFITCIATNDAKGGNITVKNVHVIGSTGYAIDTAYCRNMLFDNIIITGFDEAFHFDQSWSITISNSVIEDCTNKCVYTENICTSILFSRTVFYRCPIGCHFNGELDYSSMISCGFDNVDACIQTVNSPACTISLTGCGFEHYTTAIFASEYSSVYITGMYSYTNKTDFKTFDGAGNIVLINNRLDGMYKTSKRDVKTIGIDNLLAPDFYNNAAAFQSVVPSKQALTDQTWVFNANNSLYPGSTIDIRMDAGADFLVVIDYALPSGAGRLTISRATTTGSIIVSDTPSEITVTVNAVGAVISTTRQFSYMLRAVSRFGGGVILA